MPRRCRSLSFSIPRPDGAEAFFLMTGGKGDFPCIAKRRGPTRGRRAQSSPLRLGLSLPCSTQGCSPDGFTTELIWPVKPTRVEQASLQFIPVLRSDFLGLSLAGDF